MSDEKIISGSIIYGDDFDVVEGYVVIKEGVISEVATGKVDSVFFPGWIWFSSCIRSPFSFSGGAPPVPAFYQAKLDQPLADQLSCAARANCGQ